MKTLVDLFKITSKEKSEEEVDFYKDLPVSLFELLSSFGGSSFNSGIYRIHSFRSSIKWALLIGEYFPGFQSKMYPFGYDWMGRQFCINKDDKTIFMFDPATLEDFKLEKNLSTFHDEDLVDILGEDLFKEALDFCRIINITFNECLGYKIPLFLGGNDIVENYEKQDLEVYWHMQSQLYNQVKNLPDGTKIGQVKIVKSI